jgi:hypothetical protein
MNQGAFHLVAPAAERVHNSRAKYGGDHKLKTEPLQLIGVPFAFVCPWPGDWQRLWQMQVGR